MVSLSQRLDENFICESSIANLIGIKIVELLFPKDSNNKFVKNAKPFVDIGLTAAKLMGVVNAKGMGSKMAYMLSLVDRNGLYDTNVGNKTVAGIGSSIIDIIKKYK